MTDQITPEEAQEAVNLLLACVDHAIPSDPAIRACGYHGKLAAFIRQSAALLERARAMGAETKTSEIDSALEMVLSGKCGVYHTDLWSLYSAEQNRGRVNRERILHANLTAANQTIVAVAEWLNEMPGSYDTGDILTAGNIQSYLGDVSNAKIEALQAEVAEKTAAIMACNDEAVAKMAALTAENERLKLEADPEARQQARDDAEMVAALFKWLGEHDMAPDAGEEYYISDIIDALTEHESELIDATDKAKNDAREAYNFKVVTDARDHYQAKMTQYRTERDALTAERDALREALKPFADALELRRQKYGKRYGKDQDEGLKNFDAIPDDWPLGGPPFKMGEVRRARAALKGME